MSMDALESELRGLLSDTFNRSKLLSLLKEMQSETEKKETRQHARKEKQSPVTRYTAIRRKYTCRHCGAHYESVVELANGDSVPALDANGHVVIITSKSPVEVDCFVFHCKYCRGFVTRLNREELEERYMELLNRSALMLHTSYGK